MAFLDEEEQIAVPREPERPPRRPGGPERKRQQFLVRRLLAVGVGVGFLILLVIGVRGCLEARSDRGLRNYASDIGTIMAESEQRGKDFFEALDDSPGSIDLKNTASQVRGASESLLTRAEDLDAPSQMADAQTAATLALRLRRDGLATIADQAGAGAADSETEDPIEQITNAMGEFYASDILWSQEASPEIQRVLDEEGVEGGVDFGGENFGNFMPENSGTEFLDQTEIASIFADLDGGGAEAGTQGLALVSTTIGDVTLDPDVPVTVPDSASEVAVQVQNQGSDEQSSIDVTITVDGSEQVTKIEQLGPGETGEAKVTIGALPSPGSEVSVEVLVTPVAGEADNENNESSYTVIFGSA